MQLPKPPSASATDPGECGDDVGRVIDLPNQVVVTIGDIDVVAGVDAEGPGVACLPDVA